MFCPKCGRQLAEGELFCAACGSPRPDGEETAAPQETPVYEAPELTPRPLWPTEPEAEAELPAAEPEPDPVSPRKRSGKRGLLLGLGAAALAVLVGCGIWFLNQTNKPANKLLRAASGSAAALEEFLEPLPNLNTVRENLLALQKSSTAHLEQNGFRTVTVQGDFPQEQMTQNDVTVDVDQDAGMLHMKLSYSGSDENITLPLELYLDNSSLQLGSDLLLEEGEAISLPLKNLGRRWNASALAELSELELPEQTDLSNLLQQPDLPAALTELYGEDWTQLADSLEVRPYPGSPHFTGGTTYTLSWDREALGRMYEKGAIDLSADFSPVELLSMDSATRSARLMVSVLGKADELLQDLQLYVEDGKLLGLYLELDGKKSPFQSLALELQGEENPWEKIAYAVAAEQDADPTCGELLLTVSDGQLWVKARDPETGEDVILLYNDEDGVITFDGPEAEEMSLLMLIPVEGGVQWSQNVSRVSDSFFNYTISSVMTCTVTVGCEPIAPLTETPIELLELSEGELEELEEEILGRVMSQVN